MSKNIEIERKFLVISDDYKQQAIGCKTIIQGYLSKDPDRTIRVRITTTHCPLSNNQDPLSSNNTRAYLTIKSRPNDNGFSRFEWEKEIDPQDAEQLLALCLPTPISKTRWLVPAERITDTQYPISELIWEVDEFHGHLEGRVLAELELPSEDTPFARPAWLGEEKTGDPAFYNANM